MKTVDRVSPVRHTYAAFVIAAGVNAKALSTYMGHASITITLDRYGHLMPGNEEEAAEMLAGYLAREGWSVTPSPFSPRGTGLQNRRFQVRVLGAPLRFSQGWIARSLQGATIRAGIRRQNSSPSRSPRSANRLVRGVLTIANRSHGSAEKGPSAAPRRGRSPRCRGARAAQPVLAFCSTARAGAAQILGPREDRSWLPRGQAGFILASGRDPPLCGVEYETESASEPHGAR